MNVVRLVVQPGRRRRGDVDRTSLSITTWRNHRCVRCSHCAKPWIASTRK